MTRTRRHARRAPLRIRLADTIFMIALCAAVLIGVKVGMDYGMHQTMSFTYGKS